MSKQKYPTEIRKGGVGVNILAPGASAPRGPLTQFTQPDVSTLATDQSTQIAEAQGGIVMENEAYKWLTEVFEDDISYPHTDGWQMYLMSGDSYPHEVDRFKHDMRQLLKDAEIGRKFRQRPRYVRRNMITGEREYSHTASFDVVIREAQE